jgi:hypothetical protein
VALEIWILLALGAAAAIVSVVTRLRFKRRTAAAPPERNVYPLW